MSKISWYDHGIKRTITHDIIQHEKLQRVRNRNNLIFDQLRRVVISILSISGLYLHKTVTQHTIYLLVLWIMAIHLSKKKLASQVSEFQLKKFSPKKIQPRDLLLGAATQDTHKHQASMPTQTCRNSSSSSWLRLIVGQLEHPWNLEATHRSSQICSSFSWLGT